MIQRIRRLDVGQTAKVLGVLYLLLGIIFAALFFVFSSMIPSGTTSASDFGAGPGLMASMMVFRTGFLLVMPIMYGVFGVIFGAIIAALYNLVAGWTGGLELEFAAPDGD